MESVARHFPWRKLLALRGWQPAWTLVRQWWKPRPSGWAGDLELNLKWEKRAQFRIQATSSMSARCERVFLYLPDRLGAIQEMKRVVKPGGRIVLMDTELDTTAVYSKKLALTRKMTSIVARTMPNPNSARDLPALARQAGLKELKTEILAISAPHEFFLKVMAGSLADAVEKGVVPAAEVEEWLEEQASLEAQGDFFQAWLFVLVSGTV